MDTGPHERNIELFADPGPRIDCRHRARCKVEPLACQHFPSYVDGASKQRRSNGRTPQECPRKNGIKGYSIRARCHRSRTS
jgi:hypothetical protein